MERITRTGRSIAATFLALVVLAAPVGAAPTRAPGDLDPTFGKEGLVTTELSSELDQINAIAVQTDGKIVAGGDSWDQKDGSPRFTLVRYNPDGKLDTKFGKNGIVKTRINDKDWDAATINAMVLQPDGKIVVAGTAYNQQMYHDTIVVARFNKDGSFDKKFGSGGRVLTAIYPQTGYGPKDEAYAVALQKDGKIVVAGGTGGFPGDFAIVRYLPNGKPDTKFGKNGAAVVDIGADDTAVALAIQPDGKIIAAGRGEVRGLWNDFSMVRLTPEGKLDQKFGKGGKVTTDFMGGMDWANGLVLLPNGKIIAGGLAEMPCNGYCQKWGFAMARYNTDGSLDKTFGRDGLSQLDTISTSGAYAMTRRADGRIAMVGHIGNEDFVTVLYNEDGFPISSFGDNGLVRTSFGDWIDRAHAVAFQPDGKLVVAGQAVMDPDSVTNWDFALARYEVGTSAPPPRR
jgi:uncharacterized delta-60 repeat protein